MRVIPVIYTASASHRSLSEDSDLSSDTNGPQVYGGDMRKPNPFSTLGYHFKRVSIVLAWILSYAALAAGFILLGPQPILSVILLPLSVFSSFMGKSILKSMVLEQSAETNQGDDDDLDFQDPGIPTGTV